MTRSNGLPANLEAEAHLLGAMLLDPDTIAVAAGLPVDAFYKPAHAHIYDSVRRIHHQGRPVDPVTVADDLAHCGLLDAVGGRQALADILAQCPATSNVAAYAEIVARKHRDRRLLAVAGELAIGIRAGDTDQARSLLQDALARLDHDDGPGDGLRLTPASAITPSRPRWAWDQRIPLAGVTLVPGREGEGKTALLAHLAARWSQGDLPGDLWGIPADVIYIGHEDDRSSVLVPRLIAAGADLARFWFVDLPDGGTFTLTASLDSLDRQLTRRLVAAIIIDPLDAHLGVQDSHKKADVQAAIARLAGLTQQHRCAGVGIAHLNKGDATDVLLKVVGSVGLTTSVRSVLAIGPHPQAPEAEKVAVLRKANMTAHTQVPAVRFRVEATHITPPDDTTAEAIRTARVVLLGEQDGINADAILTATDPEARTALDEACDWLQAMLSDGPRPKRDVLKAARAEGISHITLRRAARRLRILSERDDAQQGRPATWHPPGFCSQVSAQNPMSQNPQPPDQPKHGDSGGFCSTPDLEQKPPTNPTTATRDCTRCAAPATDISHLCDRCIHNQGEPTQTPPEASQTPPNTHPAPDTRSTQPNGAHSHTAAQSNPTDQANEKGSGEATPEPR